MLNIPVNRAVRTILLVLVCLVPVHAYAEEEQPSTYTIQISSHSDLETSQKEFKDIADRLDPHKRDYLRIERVGKYFPLRLGLFKSRMEAREFLQSVKSTFPNAIVQKTVFLDERIEMMYEVQKESEEEKTGQIPSPKAGDMQPRQEPSPEVAAEKELELEKLEQIPSPKAGDMQPRQEPSPEVAAEKESEEEKPGQIPSSKADDMKPRQESSPEVAAEKESEVEKLEQIPSPKAGDMQPRQEPSPEVAVKKESEEEKLEQTPSPKAGDMQSRQEPSQGVVDGKMPEIEKASAITKRGSVSSDMSVEEKIAAISSLVQNKNYESALEIIKSEIMQQPQHPELNAWYGSVLLKTARPEEAQQYLEKAVDLSPSIANYHNGLGYCNFYLDDYDRAIESFNNAVSLEPDHVDAIAGLGIIYANKGDKETSLDYYSRLKKLDADSAAKLLKIIEHAK